MVYKTKHQKNFFVTFLKQLHLTAISIKLYKIYVFFMVVVTVIITVSIIIMINQMELQSHIHYKEHNTHIQYDHTIEHTIIEPAFSH